MTPRLPTKLSELLIEIIHKRCPGTIRVGESLQGVTLSSDQREELRQAVTDELIETGLRDDDEPNARGLLLEELIDRLGQQ